jgi:predicted DNA-binding protein (MmcQ/YjbR family)
MVTTDTCRTMAMALPGAAAAPHFDKESFKVNGKIFATLNVAESRACVKLSPIDQSVFCQYDKEVMWPVPNKWGTYGWTLINLKKVKKTCCRMRCKRPTMKWGPLNLKSQKMRRAVNGAKGQRQQQMG